MSNKTLNVTPDIISYLEETGFREHAVLKQLRDDMRKHPQVNMQIAPEQGAFMQMLVRMSASKKGIEIGTFTGYSALATALAMPEDGQLICCDISNEWTAIAEKYWQKAGVENKIYLRIAPALKTLDSLKEEAGTFDWVFIDADKENYLNYYERTLELLKPKGLILIDNALWSGEVVQPKGEDAAGIDQCNRFVHQDPRVDMVLLPVADGLLIAQKI